MSLPDYRIRFPAPLIDFSTEVGLTGQDHDNYPAPGAQARYDHLRLYLIGLLGNQASFQQPSEFSTGTIWLDLSDQITESTAGGLKIYNNNQWNDIASSISLRDGTSSTSLEDWYVNEASVILKSLSPEIFFGGRCTTTGLSKIPIPTSLNQYINDRESRIFLTVNGSAIDPREIAITAVGAQKYVDISPSAFDANDEFFVTIRRIPNQTFYTESVVI
jgi:hypothetical protein